MSAAAPAPTATAPAIAPIGPVIFDGTLSPRDRERLRGEYLAAYGTRSTLVGTAAAMAGRAMPGGAAVDADFTATVVAWLEGRSLTSWLLLAQQLGVVPTFDAWLERRGIEAAALLVPA